MLSAKDAALISENSQNEISKVLESIEKEIEKRANEGYKKAFFTFNKNFSIENRNHIRDTLAIHGYGVPQVLGESSIDIEW